MSETLVTLSFDINGWWLLGIYIVSSYIINYILVRICIYIEKDKFGGLSERDLEFYQCSWAFSPIGIFFLLCGVLLVIPSKLLFSNKDINK